MHKDPSELCADIANDVRARLDHLTEEDQETATFALAAIILADYLALFIDTHPYNDADDWEHQIDRVGDAALALYNGEIA